MSTTIIVPRTDILVPKDPIECGSTMSGHFTLELLDTDAHGEPIEASRRKVAEFDNIILDSGLNRIGTAADWLAACQVGTGTATPLATDTGLASFLGGTTTIQVRAEGAQGSAPFFGWTRRVYRIPAGVGTGNLTEVGVGWAATSGANLFSRALILDMGGQPTVITKQAAQVLDVTYELRQHPPAADVTGNVTITGSGTHAFIRRAALVTSGQFVWALQHGSNGETGGLTTSHLGTAFDGPIGAVTAGPTGAGSVGVAASNAAYSPGSFQRAASLLFDLDVANFAGGIRSVQIDCGAGSSRGLGRFQIEFDPPIMKTAARQLTLNFVHAWARRP